LMTEKGLLDEMFRLCPKSSKNYRNKKSTYQNENFPKKSIFRPLKV
jgi:hypothetical protein